MTPQPGDRLPEWTVDAVDPEKMKTMAALLRDPNPIHLDPAAVRALGMGDRVVNQAPISIGYLQNMLVAWAGGADRIRGLRLRFLAQVLAGDRVVAGGEVTTVDGAGGTVGCEVWLDVVGRPGSDATLPVRAVRGTAALLPPTVRGTSGGGTAGPG